MAEQQPVTDTPSEDAGSERSSLTVDEVERRYDSAFVSGQEAGKADIVKLLRKKAGDWFASGIDDKKATIYRDIANEINDSLPLHRRVK